MTMKTNAIRIHEYGGPEVLHYEEVELPEPGEGEEDARRQAALMIVPGILNLVVEEW